MQAALLARAGEVIEAGRPGPECRQNRQDSAPKGRRGHSHEPSRTEPIAKPGT